MTDSYYRSSLLEHPLCKELGIDNLVHRAASSSPKRRSLDRRSAMDLITAIHTHPTNDSATGYTKNDTYNNNKSSCRLPFRTISPFLMHNDGDRCGGDTSPAQLRSTERRRNSSCSSTCHQESSLSALCQEDLLLLDMITAGTEATKDCSCYEDPSSLSSTDDEASYAEALNPSPFEQNNRPSIQDLLSSISKLQTIDNPCKVIASNTTTPSHATFQPEEVLMATHSSQNKKAGNESDPPAPMLPRPSLSPSHFIIPPAGEVSSTTATIHQRRAIWKKRMLEGCFLDNNSSSGESEEQVNAIAAAAPSSGALPFPVKRLLKNFEDTSTNDTAMQLARKKDKIRGYYEQAYRTISNTTNNSNHHSTEPRAILRKAFRWDDYPELRTFLIENCDEYLHHSALNYTLEQKLYNNRLTGRMIVFAKSRGYVFDPDFFTFVKIRDRIRCYYKTYKKCAGASIRAREI